MVTIIPLGGLETGPEDSLAMLKLEWQRNQHKLKLELTFTEKRARSQFNALEDLFSIGKKENECLQSLIHRIDEAMNEDITRTRRLEAFPPSDSTQAFMASSGAPGGGKNATGSTFRILVLHSFHGMEVTWVVDSKSRSVIMMLGRSSDSDADYSASPLEHHLNINKLFCNSNIQQIVFGTRSLSLVAPKLFCYYEDTLDELKAVQPDLHFSFPNSTFSMASFNFGPHTYTKLHPDHLNVAFGMCTITTLGNFDYTKGGHLILWELAFCIGLTMAIVLHINLTLKTMIGRLR
ncbi:hypothetical protein EW146_g3667 [Bondarzewia mesenterica]|uniref:Uncharacterized protein n=1 Tax=Bondarzewia mesenterica TaxID=1095465 RepID=A0A4S4LX18_9AGAM|nr:hypothetical protein EW146_g3667 [Bondarzewia mesenterica]